MLLNVNEDVASLRVLAVLMALLERLGGSILLQAPALRKL